MDIMDFGVDVDRSWSLNDFGDLKIVDGEKNVEQAIFNRLTCGLNDLELFYDNYGSVLFNMLGSKSVDKTLEFLKIEIGNVLSQDMRLSDFDLNLEYVGDGVEVGISVFFDDSEVSVDLLIDENGVLNNAS